MLRRIQSNGVMAMAAALSLRDARMEFKTTDETKRLLSQAAALDGMDLTSFVLGPAIEKARRVLVDHARTSLAMQSQTKLAALLRAPRQKPTAAMQALMALPDLKERQE